MSTESLTDAIEGAAEERDYQHSVNVIGAADEGPQITINIVPDEMLACPECGAYWGNPDKSLDFPNRFKVDSFCKCYNPKCSVAYYDPFSGAIEYEGLQDG